MALYGVGLDVTVKRIQNDLKLHLAKTPGGLGLQKLREVFFMVDRNQNGKIEFPELEMGLSQIGFFLKKVDLQALFKFFDINQDRTMSYEEFLIGCR